MLQEDAEELGIARRELLLNFVGKAFGIGIEALAGSIFNVTSAVG